MENKINKMISLILLLSMLNGNILSMQKSDIGPKTQVMEIDQDVQQELSLLGLPAEVIEYILYQIIKPYEDNINKVNDIFEFYCQIDLKRLVSDLSGAVYASKDLRLWTLDLINRLKKLKENKYQELVNSIKDQYQGISEDELNSRLRNILNHVGVNEEAAKLILVGANANEENSIGNTALIWAAINGHKNIVRLFIDSKANVNAKNTAEDTALILATINGHKDIVELLESAKNKENQNN